METAIIVAALLAIAPADSLFRRAGVQVRDAFRMWRKKL